MSNQSTVQEATGLKLSLFDVVSTSPVKDELRISGAKLIAPSPQEAVRYMRDALKRTGRPLPPSGLPGYTLISTGYTIFPGSKTDWIQAQLKLRLNRDQKAVQLPPEDELETELEVLSKPKDDTQKPVDFTDKIRAAKAESEEWEPGLYAPPSGGGSPLFWVFLGLGLTVGATSFAMVLLPSSRESTVALGPMKIMMDIIADPGYKIGVLSILVAGAVMLFRR